MAITSPSLLETPPLYHSWRLDIGPDTTDAAARRAKHLDQNAQPSSESPAAQPLTLTADDSKSHAPLPRILSFERPAATPESVAGPELPLSRQPSSLPPRLVESLQLPHLSARQMIALPAIAGEVAALVAAAEAEGHLSAEEGLAARRRIDALMERVESAVEMALTPSPPGASHRGRTTPPSASSWLERIFPAEETPYDS